MVIRIAVDAMGGDNAPREVVHGAVLAAREFGVQIQLVGPPERLKEELNRFPCDGLDIILVPASEVVGMDENPTRAIAKKKDSSIAVATRQVAEGKADGIVAAGSTGAAAVAAQLLLGRIPNVDRSAIACFMPTIHMGRPAVMLDVGANKECDARQLLQFGLMGSILYGGFFNVDAPKVGLLNIGTEESKGTKLVQDAYSLFKQRKDINFIGFTEGRDFPLGKCDVVVTDGFTGNNCLKTAEGIAKMISVMLKQELLSNFRTKVGAKLSEPALDAVRRRTDHNHFGGALLIGVKGVYVIAHGSSKHTAIKNAVRTARDIIKADVVAKIKETMAHFAPQEENREIAGRS